MDRRRKQLVLSVVTLLLVAAAKPAMAAAPCVQFDADEIIACSEVEVGSDGSLNHDVRLVAAKFRVSSIIKFGEEQSLAQLLFAIESPQRRMHVVDYSPKAQFASRYVGNLNIEEKTEKTSAAGADIGVTPNKIVRADASASTGAKRSAAVRYELVAPRKQLSASGTLRRGSGVYFKLKPSSQTSLDGAREFEVVFRVPKGWRGDVVTLTCAGFQTNAPSSKPVCGSARFTVGLHLDHDTESRLIIEELIDAERGLRMLASTQKDAIKKHSFPSLGYKLGAALSVVDPKIPNRWLDQVFTSGASAENLPFQRHLPADVRKAVSRYASAVRETGDLAGLGVQPHI